MSLTNLNVGDYMLYALSGGYVPPVEDPDPDPPPAPGAITDGEDVTTLNTGWRGLGTLEASLVPFSGEKRSTAPGQTIEGFDITGRISIEHNGVTVRNNRVAAGLGAHPVVLAAGLTGITIEYNELYQDLVLGGDRNGVSAVYDCPTGYNIVQRNHIHHCEDGGKSRAGWIWEANYIDVGVKYGEAHNDGIQTMGAPTIVSPAAIYRYNKVIMPPDAGNGGIYFKSQSGPIGDIEVIGNWVQCSNVTEAIKLDGRTGFGFVGTATIQDNKIVQGWNGGPEAAITLQNAGTVVRSGNVLVLIDGTVTGSLD